jgi:hypothetical protein
MISAVFFRGYFALISRWFIDVLPYTVSGFWFPVSD